MVDGSKLKPEDVAKSYDFFLKGSFFERSGSISRKKLEALIAAMQRSATCQAKATSSASCCRGGDKSRD